MCRSIPWRIPRPVRLLCAGALCSRRQVISDIHAGRWDAVLAQVALLRLPTPKQQDLFEHVRGIRAALLAWPL